MWSQQPGTLTVWPFWIDTLVNLFLTRICFSIRVEIKLKNNFLSTLSNAIGRKSLIVEGEAGTTLGMKTSEARRHWIGTVEHLIQDGKILNMTLSMDLYTLYVIILTVGDDGIR